MVPAAKGCRFGVNFLELDADSQGRVQHYVSEAVRLSNYIRWVGGQEVGKLQSEPKKKA